MLARNDGCVRKRQSQRADVFGFLQVVNGHAARRKFFGSDPETISGDERQSVILIQASDLSRCERDFIHLNLLVVVRIRPGEQQRVFIGRLSVIDPLLICGGVEVDVLWDSVFELWPLEDVPVVYLAESRDWFSDAFDHQPHAGNQRPHRWAG